MKPDTISTEEAKKKTMELLGTSDPDTVAHITEDYLNSDFQEVPPSDASSPDARVFYGHSMSYGHMNGQPSYLWKCGKDPRNLSTVCENHTHFAWMSIANHSPVPGKRCGPAEYQRVLRFDVNG